MGERSQIEWTHHTFNPWWGCQRVSPGCEHCYAETFSKRVGLKVWGPESAGVERRFFGEKHWREPLRWNAAAGRAGERHRVFCASMADVFEGRDDLIEHRARLFRLIAETPHLDWLLLTKRPENVRRFWPLAWRPDYPEAAALGAPQRPTNIWLGTTAEDQTRADERIPHLLACRDLASVLFVSYEPALGPVDWRGALPCVGGRYETGDRYVRCVDCQRDVDPTVVRALGAQPAHDTAIDWIIIGGESGPGARPFDLSWARSTLRQCRATGVPVFWKQAGAHPIDCGHRIRLVDSKGGDMAELNALIPDMGSLREYPDAVR